MDPNGPTKISFFPNTQSLAEPEYEEEYQTVNFHTTRKNVNEDTAEIVEY